ncbi:MAG: hypothetical protein ABL984_14090 [Pyrinomonadaceae bacterium]
MSIRSNIEGIMDQIGDGDTALGDTVRARSTAAILAGGGTPEWETYMSMFSTTPEELARLLPTDESGGVPEMDQARTYLVGNGMCGAETTKSRLIQGVWDILDQELQ